VHCVLLLRLTSVYLNLLQILNALFIVQSDMCGGGSNYFMRKPNTLGVMRFHALHKCAMSVKMLGCGSIVDDMDVAYTMAGSTILECVKEFTSTIVDLYEVEYLRPPNESEVNSIDCVHWE
jgi:hypothetical protein